MTDREERAYQIIEAAGIALQRGIRKNKIREYTMAGAYFKLALIKIQEAQDFLGGKDVKAEAKKNCKHE